MTSSGSETGSPARDWSSRLESWKEIAAYLGRDVRTVIRWERERALPVHRVPGGRRQAVYAYREELDAWIAGDLRGRTAAASVTTSDSEQRSHADRLPSVKRWSGRAIAAAAVAVALAAAGVFALFAPASSAPVAAVVLADRAIVAVDRNGRERWRHPLGADTAYEKLEFKLVAFSHAGRPDVVVLLTEQPVPSAHSDRLIRFSDDGEVRWDIEPPDTLSFGPATYAAPWFSGPWTPIEVDGEVRIAWAVRHVTWWPSMLLTIAPDGTRLGTFVNAGWILSVVQDRDRLLISGFSNSAAAGMAAVLDARSPSGRSPEDPGGPFFCAACPAAPPLGYVTFGRSEVNRMTGAEINAATILKFDRGIEVHTQERVPSNSEVIYDVTPDLDVIRARFGDRYWDEHRKLELEKRIAHSAENCPEDPRRLAVRVWPPQAR